MMLYSDKGIEKAINTISNLYVKIARLKPTDDFTLDDIRNAMIYLDHYKQEIESEKRKRANNRNKG